MQTDTWLTDIPHPDGCPLCGQALAAGSNICPACGFAAHGPMLNSTSSMRSSISRRANPITPIPARASALRKQNASGGSPSRSTQSQTAGSFSTSAPEQTRGWRHTSHSYEAASSLSSLSLIISETPTAPPRTTRRLSRETEHLEHIDEIDTVPPASIGVQETLADLSELPTAPGGQSPRFDARETIERAFTHIDEIDTIPEVGKPSSSAFPSAAPAETVSVDATTWSSSPASTRSLVARSPRRRRHEHHFGPLDHTRWWLLRPGHIEFLLWLAGSILLFGLTLFLLLATVLSVMLSSRGNFPSSTITSPDASTPTANAILRLELPSRVAFTAGTELQLQGQGFRPRSRVIFLLDGRWPLLDQHGQAASIQTDAVGRFAVNLWLGQGTSWSAGRHEILARETDGGYQATIPITITASPSTPVQSNSSPQATPTHQVYPGATPARPQSTPTPAHPTPIPPVPPVASLTPGGTPTTSPTGAMTPVGTPTSSQKKGTGPSPLGNDLNRGNDGSLFARLSHLNPLVWFIGFCYLLSMIFMGLAGILRRRRH